ncbi:Crp/Fnr family transcriptional regulator [Pedobacter nutrimenti]|uniref:Crp/Fnr family transcriptional regulator n=1 Tax=Pedobacter nutrimenti TaxID=1241337 RepID=UPI00292E0E9C|nr:Crp/Fnr family transcriptional regulator [Pedobacter nutrimenti]
MYTSLRKLVQSNKIDIKTFELLAGHITPVTLSKGTFLIRQGQRCDHIYIIENGFARIFSVINEKETTILFAKENEIITSTYSLFTDSPSNENIEILEDSLLLKIHYGEFSDLCKQHAELFVLYRLLMEKYYLSLEERTLSLQFDSALERYQKLLTQFPYILQRAPLGQIASFLGMSPVTLSRMRAKI